MPNVPVRNLGDIQRQNPNLGQAVQDLVTAISNLKSQVATMQGQIAKINTKLGL